MRSVLIPCGGDGARWGDFRGTPKQLIDFDGTPLLELLAARLHAAGADSVGVVSADERFRVPGTVLLEPCRLSLGTDLDKLQTTRPHWQWAGRTWIVWGDVWLSEAGARAMFEPDQPSIAWYGRSGRGMLTGKRYRELWGLSFEVDAQLELVEALMRANRRCLEQREKPLAWLVLEERRRASGEPHELVEIDDRTEDFDYPRDLVRWEEHA